MTISIEFNIEDDGWLDAAPWYRELALRAADQALKVARYAHADAEISVLLCNDARIADLNRDFRGKPQPTNVLSWPGHDIAPPAPGAAPPAPADSELGDIAFARETIEREAQAQQVTTEAHFVHLFAHGVLHLLGYDHESDEDAALMERLESQAMKAMGFDDPYREDRQTEPS